MTITLVTLLCRRLGMTRADFIAWYETRHRLIGEQVLAGYATRYVRRFLTPADGRGADDDPDVILEIDFPDGPARDACFAAMADPEVMAMIVADEERLFDGRRSRSFTVEERHSTLPPPNPTAGTEASASA